MRNWNNNINLSDLVGCNADADEVLPVATVLAINDRSNFDDGLCDWGDFRRAFAEAA